MAFVGAGLGVLGGRSVGAERRSICRRGNAVMMAKSKPKQPWTPPTTEYIPIEVDFMGDWEAPPLEEDEYTEIARTAAAAADERKGKNIVALRVARLTCVTTFFVYITGGSAPQLRAIANLVEEELEEKHNLKVRYGQPGNANSGWILLDYGDLMVHVFSEEQRRYYDPESLWRNGEVLDLSSVVSPDGLKKPEDGSMWEDEFEDDDDWDLSRSA